MLYLVLGPLEVRSGSGAVVPVRRGRPRSLLHLLLMHRRVVVPTEVVADRLWDRELPQDAANAVHQLVSYLRRSLGPEGKDELVTSPVGYRLAVAEEEVDAWRFDRLVHTATTEVGTGSGPAVRRALAAAEEAARMWRGDPYPESAGYEWAAGDITRLKESYLLLQETRLEAMLHLGRHREVVLEAQSLASAYPLREQFHAQRALALYRSGRQSEALEVFRGLRALLADEMGLDPSPALQTLERQILRQDPDLGWPAVVAEPVRLADPPAADPAETPEPGEGFPVPHLPPRPPALLGRDTEVDRLTGLLLPGAVVTVTGLAGVGKSALVRTLAWSGPHQPVWYVDLGDVDTPELAPAALARQTGFSGPLPADPSSVLATGFERAEGLLVLDTCEHLLPALPQTLQAIRQRAPRLTILTTSRRPLDLPGEVVHRLDPLPAPAEGTDDAATIRGFPAVELFVERAGRVRSDFRLDDSTAHDVAEVVRCVEGVPLAVELAAANVDVLSVATIREHLTDHLGDIGSSTSFLPKRQTSLRAALDASSVLLGERERRLFVALAALRGSFGIEAARALVREDFGEPYDALASLVRQSLVAHEGGSSYRLLRPVRAYAEELLDAAPERDSVHDRHAAHVAEAARRASEELRTSTDALARLHRLLPDARAALEWALAHDRPEEAADIAVAYTWYWAINGMAEEGMRWLGSVADAREGAEPAARLDPTRRAAVLRSLGLLANPMGRVREARDYCRRAIDLSRDAGDAVGMAAALLTLGIAEWALGDFDAAAAAHDLALDTAAQTGERWHRLSALTLRARTALDAGEPDVEQRLEAAIDAAQEEDEDQMLSIAMSLLGRYHVGAGHPEIAELLAERAVQTARRINYREGELGALNVLGRARLERGLTDSATECFSTALSVASDIRHRGAMCESLESLALAASRTGRHEHAYMLVQASARERSRLGLHIPAFGSSAVSEVEQRTADVLGPAAALVQARVKLLKFEELVAELLPHPRPHVLEVAG